MLNICLFVLVIVNLLGNFLEENNCTFPPLNQYLRPCLNDLSLRVKMFWFKITQRASSDKECPDLPWEVKDMFQSLSLCKFWYKPQAFTHILPHSQKVHWFVAVLYEVCREPWIQLLKANLFSFLQVSSQLVYCPAIQI